MNKKILIFIIVIALVIIGLFAGNQYLRQTQEVTNNGQETEQTDKIQTNTITAPEQAGGTEVFIEAVTLTQEGFVVIHKVDEDGAAGEVVGVSEKLPAGGHTNLIISIEGEVTEGDALIAMLHESDGNDTFDFPEGDAPLMNANNEVIQVQFDIIGEGQLENEIKL